MGALIGQIFGALVATLLFSRLFLWLTKKLGDSNRRILIAHALCYAVTITLGTFGFANGGPLNPATPMAIYTIPQLIWLAVDFLALKGRRSKLATDAAPTEGDAV